MHYIMSQKRIDRKQIWLIIIAVMDFITIYFLHLYQRI